MESAMCCTHRVLFKIVTPNTYYNNTSVRGHKEQVPYFVMVRIHINRRSLCTEPFWTHHKHMQPCVLQTNGWAQRLDDVLDSVTGDKANHKHVVGSIFLHVDGLLVCGAVVCAERALQMTLHTNVK